MRKRIVAWTLLALSIVLGSAVPAGASDPGSIPGCAAQAAADAVSDIQGAVKRGKETSIADCL